MNKRQLFAALLLLAGCGDTGSGVSDQAAAPQGRSTAPGEKVLSSETVEGVFTGWDKGDYVWARIRVDGREPFGAWSGPSPIDLFLDAHIGKPLVLKIDTTLAAVPESGGRTEIRRLAEARSWSLTGRAWWASLSPKQRQDAQISLAGSLEPGRPPSQH